MHGCFLILKFVFSFSYFIFKRFCSKVNTNFAPSLDFQFTETVTLLSLVLLLCQSEVLCWRQLWYSLQKLYLLHTCFRNRLRFSADVRLCCWIQLIQVVECRETKTLWDIPVWWMRTYIQEICFNPESMFSTDLHFTIRTWKMHL